MINCQGCGAVNDEVSSECAACGRLLFLSCPQCSTRNLASALTCTHCGRVLAEAKSGPARQADPVSEMLAWPGGEVPDHPPQGPLMKAVLGGFAFAFLHLSQALTGYPLAGILAGLASGMVTLWGIIELAIWWLAHSGAPRHPHPSDDLEEALPGGLDQSLSTADASFEETEREAASTTAPAPPADILPTPGRPTRTSKDPLVASMVSGAVTSVTAAPRHPAAPATATPPASPDEAAADQAAPPPAEEPATASADEIPLPPLVKPADAPQPAGKPTAAGPARGVGRDVTEHPPSDDMTPWLDDLLETGHPERQAQTLAEFLDEGVTQEIDSLQAKIARSPENFSLLVKLAQLLEERGETDRALATMERCIGFNPQVAEIHLYHGTLLRRAGRVAEARESFQTALNLNRFLAKAHYQLGILERADRHPPEAREALQKCIQLTPDDPYAHYQLGMVYKESGDLNLAQMELKRACLLHPSDSYGHSQLGQIHELLKNWDQAVFEYSQALSLKPNDAFVLEKLGDVLFKKGETARARDLYQEALAAQFNPEPRTMVALATAQHKLGQKAELKPLAEEILRLSPDHPDGLYFLAMAQLARQETEAALGTLERLTQKAPERWEAWLELGRLYQANGLDEEAISAFIKASPNVTDQAGLWNSVGVLYSNRRQFEEALSAFRKAASFDYSDPQIQANLKAVRKRIESSGRKTIEAATAALATNPDQLDLYLELGGACELLERFDDALMAYQRLLALKPDSIPGLLAYAHLLKRRGKLKIAIRCYREILKIEHGHVDARVELIKANLNLGFVNEALKHAVVAQKMAPDDPRVHFLLGKIYFAKGLAPRALKEFSFVASHARDPEMISWAELMRRRLAKTV